METTQFQFCLFFFRSSVQNFSFVLTDLDAHWTFGFCRIAPKSETALVSHRHTNTLKTTVGIWISTILNTRNIWKSNFLQFGYQMAWYSDGQLMCYVLLLCTRPTIWIPDQCIIKPDGVHLSCIQMAFDTIPFSILWPFGIPN